MAALLGRLWLSTSLKLGGPFRDSDTVENTKRMAISQTSMTWHFQNRPGPRELVFGHVDDIRPGKKKGDQGLQGAPPEAFGVTSKRGL